MKNFFVQSILFDATVFSKTEARRWLSDHGYEPIKPVHETEHWLRYRISEPYQYNRFRIKKFSPDIHVVFGAY
jgi:hypothetical protein